MPGARSPLRSRSGCPRTGPSSPRGRRRPDVAFPCDNARGAAGSRTQGTDLGRPARAQLSSRLGLAAPRPGPGPGPRHRPQSRPDRMLPRGSGSAPTRPSPAAGARAGPTPAGSREPRVPRGNGVGEGEGGARRCGDR